MARYGKRFRSKRGFKKRYGRKFGKMRYRKMGSSKSRLYRQGGNFAQNINKPAVELKSLDGVCVNALCKSGGAGGTYSNDCTVNAQINNIGSNIGSGIGAPATFQYQGSMLIAGNIGRVQPLNLCTVGNQLQNRIGRKIQMRSFKFDGMFRAPVASSGLAVTSAVVQTVATPTVSFGPVMRLILVYDRQTNGAAVQLADILANPGGSGVGTAANYVGVASSNNLNNRSRFLTIFDKSYTFGSADIAGKHIKIYKKLNLPVIYTGGGTTDCYDVGSIQTGGLFLACVGDNFALAGGLGASGSWEMTAAQTSAQIAPLGPWAMVPSFRIRYTDA